jgi:hypothetical protein
MRPALSYLSKCHPGDRICNHCTKDPVPVSVPAPVVKKPLTPNLGKIIRLVKKTIKKEIFIMPVATKWYNMIISGEKPYKFFSRKVNQDRIGKIVLMRAVTPDSKSRIVVGAVILGDYDPSAPLDPKLGFLGKWKYAYRIQCYIPFSRYRCFACKTVAGGTPKLVTDTDVLAYTKQALEVFCGGRLDE